MPEEPRESIQNNVPGYAVLLHHRAQILERIELNLPHALSRHADFFANLLKRRATMTVQTKPPIDHRSLLVIELANPVIDDRIDNVLLRAA